MMVGKEVRNVMKKWVKRFGIGALIVGGVALFVRFAHKIPTLIGGLIILPILLYVNANVETRIGPEHYQYTYEIREEWGKEMSKEAREYGLFGYGEYKYNSYLLLFPRETPSTLEEYYFRWEPMMDVDGFAVYFTCKLTEANYACFTDGLAIFAMHTETGDIQPIYDTEHFQHPTYILQWLDADEKWEVLEYIMLDEVNHTAVFVYTTLGMQEKVEVNSSYTTMPSGWDILLPEQKMSEALIPPYHDDGFSIYANFDTATYDLSFLDYLK